MNVPRKFCVIRSAVRGDSYHQDNLVPTGNEAATKPEPPTPCHWIIQSQRILHFKKATKPSPRSPFKKGPRSIRHLFNLLSNKIKPWIFTFERGSVLWAEIRWSYHLEKLKSASFTFLSFLFKTFAEYHLHNTINNLNLISHEPFITKRPLWATF